MQEVSMEKSGKTNEEDVEELPLRGNQDRTIKVSREIVTAV